MFTPRSSVMSSLSTPFRRPCLLRAEVETNVDPPRGRVASVSPHFNPYAALATSAGGGACAPDYRTITLDTPARIAPHCSGLHKGSVGSPTHHRADSKQDRIRTQQAFGVGNVCDLDLIMTRRPHSLGREESPGSPASLGSPSSRHRRTKVEALRGMPLSGPGADIDLLGGRRCDGYRSREKAPHEWKAELNSACIDKQFRRRHFSAPPDTRSTEKFAHLVHAENYAALIGRPELGSHNRSKFESPRRRSQSQQPFRVEARNLKGSLFSSTSGSLFGSGQGSAKEFASFQFDSENQEYAAPTSTNTQTQSIALIAALREATQDVPAEEVWDSMLNAFDSAELLSPDAKFQDASLLGSPANLAQLAMLTAAVNDGVKPRVGSPGRTGSPAKNQGRAYSPARNLRSSDSARSLMSGVSTAADTEGGTPKPAGISNRPSFGISSVEGSSVLSSPDATMTPVGSSRRPRTCRTSAPRTPAEKLRDAQRKANLRASWVS